MDIEKIFTGVGGRFVSPPGSIRSDLKEVESFIFDWDGVFNDGSKKAGEGSSFSEVDSMGINLLRFSRWLVSRKVMPVFIITGENNPPALELTHREFYNGAFLSFKDKKQALGVVEDKYKIAGEKIAVVFDDVLDLSLAQSCKLSFWAGRKSTPLLEKYILSNNICSYITGSPGGQHAVREICELIMGLEGTYETVLQHRIAFSPEYREYLEARKNYPVEEFRGKDYKETTGKQG